MTNTLKSLLCIILLSVSTQNVPMIAGSFVTKLASYKTGTQSRKIDASGTAFSISEVAPMLYVAAGVIFGGFLIWKVSSLEKRTNKQEKRANKRHKLVKNKFKQTDKEIADLHQDVICLNSDISLIRDDIDVLDNDISVLNRLHNDFARTKNELEKYRELTVRLTEENLLFKEAIGERVDRALFGLKPRIDSLESKVKNLKHRMTIESISPSLSYPWMSAAPTYNSSRTASTSSSGSSSPVESL